MKISPPTTPPWASYIEKRNPQWKFHQTEKAAMQVFSARGNYNDNPPLPGIVFKWNNDKNEWDEVTKYEVPDKCQMCRVELNQLNPNSPYKTKLQTTLPKRLPPKVTGQKQSKIEQLIVCAVCHYKAYLEAGAIEELNNSPYWYKKTYFHPDVKAVVDG